MLMFTSQVQGKIHIKSTVAEAYNKLKLVILTSKSYDKNSTQNRKLFAEASSKIKLL